MLDYTAQQLASLKAAYGGRWDIWYVPRYIGPTVWCAKPAGAPIATINADSHEELVRAIQEAERSLPAALMRRMPAVPDST